MELTTPALLFPAISLLLLAYTNRFLVLGQLIRDLANRINEQNRQVLYPQIDNLRQRVRQIIWMQALGVSSFILCTITMILLYLKQAQAGHLLFGLSLLSMVGSLVFSLNEIRISGRALDVQLSALDDRKP